VTENSFKFFGAEMKKGTDRRDGTARDPMAGVLIPTLLPFTRKPIQYFACDAFFKLEKAVVEDGAFFLVMLCYVVFASRYQPA
jgi:hypothetical protein